MKVFRSMCFVLGLLALTVIITRCGGSKKESEEMTTWAEMDAYHNVMADAFHPLKDSANLAPAKANAELLASEAEKWAAAPLPEKVKNDEMAASLESLKTNSRAFAEKVNAGATDEELATLLNALHDEFHHIMEVWEGGGKHGEHH